MTRTALAPAAVTWANESLGSSGNAYGSTTAVWNGVAALVAAETAAAQAAARRRGIALLMAHRMPEPSADGD